MSDNKPSSRPPWSLGQILPILRSFLSSAAPLSESAARFAGFLCEFFPLEKLALSRVTAAGTCKEFACWSGGGPVREQEFRAFADRFFPSIVDVFRGGHHPSGESLEKMMEKISPNAAEYFPAVFPLELDGNLTGLAFVGKARKAGAWTDAEKEMLSHLTALVGLCFSNKNINEDYHLQSWVFNAMMDSMRANLYVTDVKTDEILFMNKTMKKTFGVDQPEGQICWKVLQKDMDARCSFCPVDTLLQDKTETPSFFWEEHNTLTERDYENYDSLMRWVDGRLVHFQQSVDVTESRMLSKAANIDELTEMLNRRAGKEALKNSLKRMRRENTILTVCLYDVNILKSVNDAYGHLEGDLLLSVIAGVVKNHLDMRDYCFRLSGDEFVIVFYGVSEQAAAQKISQIRQALIEKRRQLQKSYDISICCGLLEVSGKDHITLSDILARADQKMYVQKREYHSRHPRPYDAAAEPSRADSFSYDKEHLYDALIRSTEDYIYLCNMKTNTFRFPPAMVEEFGLPGEIVPDATSVWGNLLHKNDQPAFYQSMQDITEGRTNSHNLEYRVKNRRGEWVWLRCRGHLERESGLFAGIITNLGKKNQTDSLTGLYNKFEFENYISTQLCNSAVQHLAVMVLGLDDLKHINNLYDRSFGDEVIRITTHKIQSLLPDNAWMFRLDGDEFGVVFLNAEQNELTDFYMLLQNKFSVQQEYNGSKYYCTVSAGCSFYPDNGDTYLDLLKYASYSLEYAKAGGKNRIVFFSQEILSGKTLSLGLMEELRRSVENDFAGFSLYYQPQVHADSREVKGAEALARWHCDAYGHVPPLTFIPLLEESGLILPVGRWIFREAVRTCAQWVKVRPEFTLSINLSYLQLSDPEFTSFMKKTLQEFHLSPSSLVVELTESYIASSIESVRRIFREIRGMGIRIAMDDFGTGYSSLEILKQSPADIVKIDRAFVKDIRSSSFDATFIKFIVELCHGVDIDVCLEGVELEEEYRIVKGLNLNFIQGYLFGKPCPKELFEHTYLDSIGHDA